MTRPAEAGLIVVGSGIAGLYAALLAADAGLPVTLLTSGELEASNSFAAQGGICAVLGEDQRAAGDSVDAHVADTLAAGAGLCDEDAVRLLCSAAAQDIATLERFGVRFDRGADGAYSLGLEAAHSHPRILHVGGDATGAGMVRALVSAVVQEVMAGKATLVENARVTGLPTTTPGAAVRGVRYERAGVSYELAASDVLLATGGAGRLFARTTNPVGALAEGVGLALEAGAVIRDAEFLQFHPTALRLPGQAQDGWLVSEAVRGEGAVLLDADGVRFMPEYHPLAELAPRDVVSRAVADHLNRLGAPGGAVYLDARPIVERHGAGFLSRRFPSISAALALAGIDWERQRVPVAPAAHYWMGGVATDLDGRTSVPGLWAAGEVACTGVHGANRLASNSLLEGLVFGRRVIEALVRGGAGAAHGAFADVVTADPTIAELAVAGLSSLPAVVGSNVRQRAQRATLEALQELMTTHAGMSRTAEGLAHAAATLDAWLAAEDVDDAGLRLSLLAARALVAGAQARAVGVGAHFRSDAPAGATPDLRHQGWLLSRCGHAMPASPEPLETAGRKVPTS
ncbi:MULTISPECIES: FAD-dependent oxidoreductase [Arthrobacter]|uniref:L-aspartate oxidase n=2 Tax=Arthrobacter TaxID=1663 RepID=A0ABU9KP48_9MICC|nr:FAD-dependent oxidoreductase [Arthrobacter sp. YJM1]MDP5228693.1 FAD-dependent oxidoreductase [Arthrobacter sp. YJM1]